MYKADYTAVADASVGSLEIDRPFKMELGGLLPELTISYETYGKLNSEGSNAILVCHALTGDAHASSLSNKVSDSKRPGWWDGITGPGKGLNTDEYFVVCSNFLGSCYGTTGPSSVNPETGKKYGIDFPQMTPRDMVRAQYELIKYLEIKKIAAVIGGSLGGMQAIEWALLYPGLVERIIPIATSARHSAWAIGLNEIQRKAIMDDPDWQNGKYTTQPKKGLATARMIAMMSYRCPLNFEQKFGRSIRNNSDSDKPFFEVESYLHYQGEKLVNRFDANTYLYITRAMDLHDISRGRGNLHNLLASIKAKTLSVGIDTDLLYPATEQMEIAGSIPGAYYREIKSPFGHDAFLIEFEQLNTFIKEFLESDN